MKSIKFYCDGASQNNGNKSKGVDIIGSFGGVMVDESNNILMECKSGFYNVTNNQMELYGFINLFYNFIKRYSGKSKYKIIVTSDSQYLVKGVNEWLEGWKNKGWKNSSKKIIENLELWKIIDEIISFNNKYIELEFKWVKGHTGKNIKLEENVSQFFNEKCDSLAVETISSIKNNKIDTVDFNEVIKEMTIEIQNFKKKWC